MSTVLDLDEIELHRTHLSEGLNAILSSVLFLRGPVRQRVRDVCCDFLSPLVYPGYEDPSIRTAIDNVLELSTFIGPSLYRCRIGLDFFFIKESSSLFGFVKRNEKVVLESWRLPLILNDMATLDEEPVLMIPKRHGNFSSRDSNGNPGANNNNVSMEHTLGSSRFLRVVQEDLVVGRHERARIVYNEREAVSSRILAAALLTAPFGDLSPSVACPCPSSLQYSITVTGDDSQSQVDRDRERNSKSISNYNSAYGYSYNRNSNASNASSSNVSSDRHPRDDSTMARLASLTR